MTDNNMMKYNTLIYIILLEICDKNRIFRII